MNRHDFLKSILAIPLLFSVKSCFTSPQSGLEDDVEGGENKSVQVVSVSANHGHDSVTLTAEHIENRTPNTYRLLGPHEHRFDINQAQLDQLLAGNIVLLTARDLHFHQFELFYGEPGGEGGASQ